MKINELAALAPGFVQAPQIAKAHTQQYTIPAQDVDFEKFKKSINKEMPKIDLKDVNKKPTEELDDYTDEQKPEILSKKISDLLLKLDKEININQIGKKPEPWSLSTKEVINKDLFDEPNEK